MKEATLIKTENNLILCNDEQPQFGELCKSVRYNDPMRFGSFENSYAEECKKYLAQLPNIILSDDLAKEIGWVDVEQLANKHCSDCRVKPNGIVWKSYIIGFQKYQELNQNKYTKRDMGNLWQHIVNAAKAIMMGSLGAQTGSFEDYIQSVSKSQWEVEVEKIGENYHVLKIL